jgi:hypothetical protein
VSERNIENDVDSNDGIDVDVDVCDETCSVFFSRRASLKQERRFCDVLQKLVASTFERSGPNIFVF